jgi:hypothetical protein
VSGYAIIFQRYLQNYSVIMRIAATVCRLAGAYATSSRLFRILADDPFAVNVKESGVKESGVSVEKISVIIAPTEMQTFLLIIALPCDF